ncbi:MAG: LamG domain-containing protein [Verrucomicrobiota bacterium]
MKPALLFLPLLLTAPCANAALIASWNLDELSGNVNSSAGTYAPGTPTGTPDYGQPGVPNGTYGAIAVVNGGGSSMTFGPSNVDEFFTVGTDNVNAVNAIDRTGSFTVMAWIKTSLTATVGTYRPISTGSGAGADGGWGFGLRINATTGIGSSIRFTTYAIADNNSPLFDVSLGQWTHLATTYSNGAINYFLNGVQLATGSTSLFNNDLDAARLTLGSRLGANDTDQVNGGVDGIRVYDTVLSAGEIASAAAASVSAVPEPSALSAAALGLAALARRRRR